MKKLITILLSLTLVLSLAACGNKDTTPEPDTGGETAEKQVLKISGLEGGYGVKHWEALAKQFEDDNEGVTVELTLEQNIPEVLRPQLQAGDYPDVIYLSIGYDTNLIEALIKEEAVMDLTDVLEMEVPGESVKVKDKIIPGFTDTSITNPYGDGKTYLAPLFYGPTGLFYNADLFGEGKYTLPTTWDEMFALGDEAKEDGIALFSYPTTGYFDTMFPGMINTTAGTDAYEKAMEYDVDTWKSPEVKKAFEIIGQLAPYVHKDAVSQGNPTDFTKNQQHVLDNEALFITNGAWLPGEMAEAPRVDGFEWGFMSLPQAVDGGDRFSFTFFEQMHIPKEAANPELAKKFMAFMYSDVAAKIIFDESGAVQPIVGAESNFGADDAAGKAIYEVYDDGSLPAMGGFAAAPAVEGVNLSDADGILYGTIAAVFNGDKTVEEWHAEVVAAVEQIKAAIDAQ